jgi:hypothetical protein
MGKKPWHRDFYNDVWGVAACTKIRRFHVECVEKPSHSSTTSNLTNIKHKAKKTQYKNKPPY